MSDIYWIADASSNHMNSLQEAYRIIESAAKSGASACKFQAFNAKTLIDKKAIKKIGNLEHQTKWKDSIYNVYKKYQLKLSWVKKLKKCCIENNIDFMCTPYYFKAVDEIDKYVTIHKIGSGDINYLSFLEYIAKKRKPVYLGCGAATETEILNAKLVIRKHTDVKLLLCNTNYTAEDTKNLEYLNLNCLDKMDGISDHTKLQLPIIITIAKGKRIIERHFKRIDNESPDNDFSMNPQEWEDMLSVAKMTLLALGDGELKIEKNELITRVLQRRDMKTKKRPDISYYLKGNR